MSTGEDLLEDACLSRREQSGEPEVSVIVPGGAESGGRLLAAVESVLAQTFTGFELIISAEGLGADGKAALEDLQQRDRRVSLILHHRRAESRAVRFNEALEIATGRNVAVLFPEDVWLPTALAALCGGSQTGQAPVILVAGGHPEGRAVGEGLSVPPVNAVTLTFSNVIGHRPTLVPREVFSIVGVADCHLAMCRFWDWDLWMRCSGHVGFCEIEAVLGHTDPPATSAAVDEHEVALFRFIQSIERNEVLGLANWRRVDSRATEIAGVPLPDYLAPRRRQPPVAVGKPRRGFRTLLWTADSYPAAAELCLGHYDRPTFRATGQKTYYRPLAEIGDPGTLKDDGVLLVRASTEPGSRLIQAAAKSGIPVAYYLDDDLLHLHEYGAPWGRLGPESEEHREISRQITAADCVWATSPRLGEVVHRLNPRVVPHHGSVEERWLPISLRPRGAIVKVGYVGTDLRREEFARLWQGLEAASRRAPGRLEFEFWGLDVSAFPPLAAPTRSRPFLPSYRLFLEQLRQAEFDVLLCPLLDTPSPRRAKAPSKAYHVAVAGALGIFSDVAVYEVLLGGVTCLKVANEPEAWTDAILAALEMPAARFDGLRKALLEQIRLDFTTEAQLDLHEAAIRAMEVHGRTRSVRPAAGRPRILLQVEPRAEGEARREALAHVLGDYGFDARELRVDIPPNGESGDALDRQLQAVAPCVLWSEQPAQRLAEACSRHGILLVPGLEETLDAVPPWPAARETAFGLERALAELLPDRPPWRGLRPRVLWAGGPEAVAEVPLGELARALARRGLRVEETAGPLDVETAREVDVVLVCEGPRASQDLFLAWTLGIPVVAPGRVAASSWAMVACDEAGTEAFARAVERVLSLSADARWQMIRAGLSQARTQAGAAVARRVLADLGARLESAESCNLRPGAGFGESVPPSKSIPPDEASRLSGKAPDPLVALAHRFARFAGGWRIRRRGVLVVYEARVVSVELYYGHALRALERFTRRPWELRASTEVSISELRTCHTIIFQRAHSSASCNLLAEARRAGCRTIYDADDNLLLLEQAISDPQNPWRLHFGSARREIEELLAGVDLIKVYSRGAVAPFLRHNCRVEVVPPFHTLLPDASLPPRSGERLRIGFFGSAYKDEEFPPLLQALSILLEKRAPLELEFFGFCPGLLRDRPQVRRLEWCRDYFEFRRRLFSRGWGIGLAPLRDLDFHRCKTAIKYREYAASGVAGVYSDAEVYREAVTAGQTGLLVSHDDTQAWLSAIAELVENEPLRVRLSSSALADLRENYRLADYARRVAHLVG